MRFRSISFVLTALFTAVAFATIGTVCIALYLELKRELASRQSEELLGKMELIRHLASEVKSEQDWSNLTRIIDDIVIGHGELRVWIGKMEGEAVYGGRRMPQVVSHTNGEIVIRREDGVPLRAVANNLSASAALPGTDIVVALDERAAQRTLAEFRVALGAVTLLSVLIAAALGAVVARRGLAPVHRLADQTSMIDPGQLSKRLATDQLPAELQDLGASFNGVLERLELAYKQMEAFNSDVAHELRSPLANLIGGTQLALSRDRDADFYREMLASNLEELERLKSMINDMLFLARADRGDHIERHQQVDLVAEAHRVVEYYESALDEARVRAEVSGAGTASADVGLVRRALSNLLSNAIRYTPAGGACQIGVRSVGEDVEVFVQNPGPAIDPAHLPHLFTRFFRADTARATRDQHHGLGLAIVKAIARMHGGDVFATSGAGTTRVGLRLPIRATAYEPVQSITKK